MKMINKCEGKCTGCPSHNGNCEVYEEVFSDLQLLIKSTPVILDLTKKDK